MIDTHCHIDFESYDADREVVIARAGEIGVSKIINPAIDIDTSRQIIRLAAQFEGLYAAVGIHPNSSKDFSGTMVNDLAEMANEAKVVAIGEIGLDYHWDKSPKATQFTAFEAQLALAVKLQLPVIIHNREASDDVMAILEIWAKDLPPMHKDRPGVLHSFSAPAEIAQRALAAGFYLGFTGPITYKNADDLRQVAAMVPLDRLLVETDGPFLTPVPYRGKRNEPAYIPLIVERLAALHCISAENLAQATTENAIRLFNLPSD